MSASAVLKEHDWQVNRSVLECNRYMLENQLACDVTFHVSGDGKKPTVFHAHKYVLSARSPVFFAMLAGEFGRIEGPQAIPDVQPVAFRELLKFLYYEDCDLSPENCLAVLYAAKKYFVPLLENKCTDFLKTELNSENLCLILDQSLVFNEQELTDACLQRLATESPAVVESESFTRISRDCLTAMLKAPHLKLEESDVFNACLKWARSECERRNKEATGPHMREALGDAIYEIHFPAMQQKYFAENVARSSLLLDKEVVEILLYFTNKEAKPPKTLHFKTEKRIQPKIAMCFLYDESVMYLSSQARYDGQQHGMKIMCNRKAALTAVGMYVNKGGSNYEYTLTVKHDSSGDSLYYRHGYSHLKPNKEDIAVIRLDEPIHLMCDVWYCVVITLQGPECGMFGIALLNRVDMDGFQVEFERLHGDDNGDSSQDQVPYLEFIYSGV